MPTFRFVGLGNWLMRRRFANPVGYSRHPKQRRTRGPQVRTLDGFVLRRTGDDKICDFALSANPGGADKALCPPCQ